MTTTPDSYPLRTWERNVCAVFRRVRAEFGEFSNMATGFPLLIANTPANSSEALYQALRFTKHPGIQLQILSAAHPLESKRISRENDAKSAPSWTDMRVEIMRYCVSAKLSQHFNQLRPVLIQTGNTPIVEESKVDAFWGAVGNDFSLRGCNVLGCLWTEIRDALFGRSIDTPLKTSLPSHVNLLGLPLPEIYL